MQAIAIGQDTYWLVAVKKALVGWAEDPHTVECPDNIPNCISNLPPPRSNTVLLVDASGQGDMEQVVATLRTKGWRYVIVVAADPSAKEATAVLRRNLAYDYWEKTYEVEEICNRVKACFDEITAELPHTIWKPD